jgi:membrane protease YdiL (CAAX protease family)
VNGSSFPGALEAVSLFAPARALLPAGGALAVAALLYLMLAEPGQPPRGGALRRAVFALLGAVVFLVLAQPHAITPGSPGRAFEAYTRASLDARRSFAGNPMLRGDMVGTGDYSTTLLGNAIRGYEAAVRAYPESVTYQRELAALYAAAGRWPDALHAGNSAADLLARRGAPEAATERRVWQLAAGPNPPRAADLRPIAKYAERTGWFGRILLYALEKRVHRADAARRELAIIQKAADAQMIRIVVIALVYIATALLGIVVLIGIAIAIGTRNVRGIPAATHPVSSILWEGFILYMFLTVIPALPRLAGRPSWGPAARSAGDVVGMALFTEAFGFIGIAYLWWRLRQRGLGLAEMGLHARRLAGDIGWGALAYVATQPIILAAGIITQHLTQRYFPNVPPPYHPVIGLMLGGSGFWTQAGLLVLLAVAAPLFEETFFRGALHGALRRRLGPGMGACLSAAVFAILHPQLPLGFLPIFLLGITFSLLYEWRQSLVPGMVMHALNNGLIFLTMRILFPSGR